MGAEAAENVEDDPFGLLAGTEPVSDDDEKPEGDADESPEAGGDPEPEPEPKASESDPGEGEEPEPLAAEQAESAEASASGAEPEPTIEELQAEIEKMREHNRGVQRALTEQRQRNAQLKQAQVAQVPNPAQYGQPGAPQPARDPSQAQPPPGYQVSVSPDGQTVYVPREAIASDVQAQAQAAVQEQMAAFRQEQTAMVEQTFVRADPEANGAILNEARMADQYVGLAIQNATMSGALYVDPMSSDRVGALIDAMRVAGIVDEVEKHFPSVGAHFDSFFRAYASQSPQAKADVYSEIASARKASAAPSTPEPQPSRVVEPVRDVPTSMVKKGSARSDDSGGDEREFATLWKTFLQDPGKLSDEKAQRMSDLGVRLGKDGFDEE